MQRMRPAMLAAAICGIALAAGVFVSGSSANAPTLHVVARNLNNPRKIFVGADGSVYVVEAGSGAFDGTRRCNVTCVGSTGAVVRVSHGNAQPYITDLGSFAVPTGQEAQGPAAFQIEHGTNYVLMQDMEITSKGVNRVGLPDAGDLVTTPAGRVHASIVANFAAFEAAHNPDRGAGPGAQHGQPPIDSDPYDFVPYRGGFAVVDAAANDLLWLSPKGKISVLAVFPIRHERLTTVQANEESPPKLNPYPVQSVPTSVAVGPDGALYVGELTGWPYTPGSARVWRVVPGKKPVVYAPGFTTISALAFDGKNLLVLELAAKGLLDPTSPGALIEVSPNGKRTQLASAGLSYPSGLAVDGGSIYISNGGTDPGSGAGPHGELVSLPASIAG
jgi:hypothetical protein